MEHDWACNSNSRETKLLRFIDGQFRLATCGFSSPDALFRTAAKRCVNHEVANNVSPPIVAPARVGSAETKAGFKSPSRASSGVAAAGHLPRTTWTEAVVPGCSATQPKRDVISDLSENICAEAGKRRLGTVLVCNARVVPLKESGRVVHGRLCACLNECHAGTDKGSAPP
jgi:hypothetical protein